jgi:hypothetical protein
MAWHGINPCSMSRCWVLMPIDTRRIGGGARLVPRRRVEVKAFLTKVTMTLASVFVTHAKWQSGVLFVGSALLVYEYLLWQPHMSALLNHLRVGIFSSVFVTALLAVMMAHHPGLDVDDYNGRREQACVRACI